MYCNVSINVIDVRHIAGAKKCSQRELVDMALSRKSVNTTISKKGVPKSSIGDIPDSLGNESNLPNGQGP